jgi:hypothetical protein
VRAQRHEKRRIAEQLADLDSQVLQKSREELCVVLEPQLQLTDVGAVERRTGGLEATRQ